MIESAVAGIPYEKAPSSPYQYTNEAIADCELLAGNPFPEDFKWYLLHVGWRRLSFDHRSMLVPNGEYIYHLQFEAAEHQAFAISRYKQYLQENTLLPHEKSLYFPFGKASGEINPSLSYQLFVSLNQEDYGAVWAVLSNTAPVKIADSFTLFLAQISTSDKLKPVAAANNQALFLRLTERYVPGVLPTTAADADQLILLFFTQPFVLNGARNVVFQYLSNGTRVENEQQFATRAAAFEKWADPSAALSRKEIRISAPVLFENGAYFKWEKHNYYLVTVDSIVGDQSYLREEFLLYHDVVWSMVRRYRSAIDDVKIKGLGTFTFDDTYKWTLKKKVTPAWSELAAELNIDGEEDAMSTTLIAFVKEALDKADFKPALEAYIFNNYLEMPDAEKPLLATPQEVWQQLGKNCSIYIDSENTFRFHVDCGWDQEHGVTVRVKDWEIQ
ncbi:hypothetical protein GO495_20595 [Chitinophaga oryziterrae]|uniref:DUF6985 domain-containing protein n=1 Tax=Chitinophaga oryziterrae TaxID=1031224 RepID=A0A6N8JFA3_9BACT|nr:SMI1/KNR4 family protein [Chitinophaga oryziterrae]MVT43008.1 hypothetical protein [Chitinophaga oryziterrae]